MRKIKQLLIVSLITLFAISCSDDDKDLNDNNLFNTPLLPNKEIRGAWIATAWGLDWPMGNYGATEQKELYIQYLNLLQASNMNAVFFQVRPMQGLFYDSEFESYSQYITGTLGDTPSYDVLRFMIDEAHSRGIQFHAWFNPYRIATRADSTVAFPELDAKINADLVVDYEKIRMYNPALPEVKELTGKMMAELIAKYPDVDGLHIDDYFYPAGESINDASYYDMSDKTLYRNVEEFRRANVDAAVLNMRQFTLAANPNAVFSISPAGNNDYNLNTMYADVLKWSQEGWADFIIPQLYYPTGTASTSFNQSLHWWSQFTYNNLLVVGYGLNNFSPTSENLKYITNEDLKAQFDFAKSRRKVHGSVMYSMKYMVENQVDIMEAIRANYADPTFIPYYDRFNIPKPSAPNGVSISGNHLVWNGVADAVKYAVYRSNGNGKVATMIGVTDVAQMQVPSQGDFFVTAIGAHNAESDISAIVTN